jgi:hypothetical protein
MTILVPAARRLADWPGLTRHGKPGSPSFFCGSDPPALDPYPHDFEEYEGIGVADRLQ